MDNKRYRMLVVDDEPAILTEYTTYFSKRGFDVETAPDGQSGLDKLRQGEFDVAIIDLIMPVMNGIELVRAARDEGIDTSIIIATGAGEKEDAVTAVKLHVDDWFQKDQDQLPDLLDSARKSAEGIPVADVRRMLSAIDIKPVPGTK